MAKFLPFVVEKSTPLHIYQTIVSRSKGMNSVLVASIFWLIVDKGITEIRNAAKELPDMDTGKLYDELLNKYSSYRISSYHLEKFNLIKSYVANYALKEINDDLKQYEIEDIMNFLLVMYYTKQLKEYTTLPLEKLFNGDADEATKELDKYSLFSNYGIEKYFSSKEELRAYIWFHSTIFTERSGDTPVKAIFSPEEKTSPGKKFKKAK